MGASKIAQQISNAYLILVINLNVHRTMINVTITITSGMDTEIAMTDPRISIRLCTLH